LKAELTKSKNILIYQFTTWSYSPLGLKDSPISFRIQRSTPQMEDILQTTYHFSETFYLCHRFRTVIHLASNMSNLLAHLRNQLHKLNCFKIQLAYLILQFIELDFLFVH